MPLAPPIVVAPGRIRVLLWGGSNGVEFRIVDLTSAGAEVFAEGACPYESRSGALALLASGATGVVCLGGEMAYFGVVKPGGGKVDWIWQDELQLGGDKWHVLAVRHLAEVGDKVALVFELGGSKGGQPPARLAVQFAPGGVRHFLSAEAAACPEEIVAVLSVGTALRVIGKTAHHYSEFVVGPSAEPSAGDPTSSAPVTAGSRPSCVTRSEDGSVIVTLPLEPARGATNAAPHSARLRYTDASLPEGPFVEPAATASCSWGGFDVPELPRIPGRFDWARATRGEHWLMVYRRAAPCPNSRPGNEPELSSAAASSFWVYREPPAR
ncbi:hypothetical protein ACMHYB_52420 [Sorangium sp. So ce1128]